MLSVVDQYDFIVLEGAKVDDCVRVCGIYALCQCMEFLEEQTKAYPGVHAGHS